MLTDHSAFYLVPPHSIGSGASGPRTHREVISRTLVNSVSVSIRENGFFAYDFSSWEHGKRLADERQANGTDIAEVLLERCNLMNVHLLCLYATMEQRDRGVPMKMVVFPLSLIPLRAIDDESLRPGDRTTLAWLRQMATAQAEPISREIVVDSLDLLDRVLALDEGRLRRVADLYLRAVQAQEQRDYAAALLAAWPIMEAYLYRIWRDYLAANQTRPLPPGTGTVIGPDMPTEEAAAARAGRYVFLDKQRMGSLNDSRVYSASVITEFLSFAGAMPQWLYGRATAARRARNKWLHELKPVTELDAQQAVEAVPGFIEQVDGVSLRVPAFRMLQGLPEEEVRDYRARRGFISEVDD